MDAPFALNLNTGYGSWNPLYWVAILVVAWLVAWFVRSFGRADFRNVGDKDMPFISGNETLPDDQTHIGGSNLYWGFTEALQGYYKRLVPLHTGDVSDYILWLLGTIALVFVLVFGF